MPIEFDSIHRETNIETRVIKLDKKTLRIPTNYERKEKIPRLSYRILKACNILTYKS